MYEKSGHSLENVDSKDQADQGRREFLARAGRFAAFTPPAVTLLLHTTMNSPAIAGSGGKPGWGKGDKNHEHSGPPGLAKKGE